MIRVILAEKPDQAREYGKALGTPETKSGVIIVKNSPYLEGEIHIVAARGHLFEYDYPKIDWNMDNLPIVDVDLKLALKAGDADIKRRFKVINDEVSKADEVIIGTDADREGERIAYTILSQIKGGLHKATKRLWINSMTTEGIRKSLAELKDAKETKPFYHEAEARSQSDWYVGFNLSPLVTLDLQQLGKLERKKGNAMSVGRVQTPTVSLICANDTAIRDFVSEPFWKVVLLDQTNKVTFSNDTKYTNPTDAQAAIQNLSNQAQITDVKSELKRKPSLNLFDLTSLQSFGAKQWKKSSDNILKIAQALYEKKYLTYPRTDSKFITHFEFTYLKEKVQDYQKLLGLSFNMGNSEPRKKYVDDKKVKEHFAIVPTEQLPDLSTLSEDERMVYEAVTKRTLGMFAEDYVYQATTVTIVNNGVSFIAKGTSIVTLGFKAFVQSKEAKDIILPPYQQGELLPVNVELRDDKTKPPSRMTEAHLMGKVFPKYGLGTPATRASIVETIQKRGYVRKDKKTDELFPTERGYLLINYLKENEFANPETTAGWEQFLKKIGSGELSKDAFVSGIKNKIAENVNQVKNTVRKA